MSFEGFVLLVVGSLTAKIADRTKKRSEIATVQAITSHGEVLRCEYFDSFGELGVSSLAFDPEKNFMYFSTGSDLFCVDLRSGNREALEVDGLVDVHEMDFIGGDLVLANTGNDEIVSINPKSGAVSRESVRSLVSSFEVNDDGCVDRFHLNQVFKGLDGRRYGLVHHVEGKQLFKRIAARVLKSQGNGGCIRLDDGFMLRLGLHAPHTVTLVGDEYWVFDSGKALIKVLDKNWNPIEEIQTAGWGRGASLIEVEGQAIFAAGLSNIRKRYIDLFENAETFINGVQFFDAKSKNEIRRIELSNIEQVNNVYFVERKLVERFF